MSNSSAATATRAGVTWTWLIVALFAHTGWGAYPVLARYLQTISHLPSMAILALGNAIALLIYLPFAYRHLDRRVWLTPIIWLFALVVSARAMTNLTSARFTLAIYVQLITLLTPLIVALMSKVFFRERLPPFTLPAIGLSIFGSLLMMSGDLSSGAMLRLTGSDLIGIAIAFVSACALALYMILIPRATGTGHVRAEAMLLIQLIALTVTCGAMSLLLSEPWQQFTVIGPFDWAVFAAFIVFVLLGANLGQIVALRQLGAPMVSSTMGWRLISALALAALLLGEQLQSVWQVLGAGIVLVTITIYLRRSHARK
ncbi:DMT family transporter [Chloroflexus sp.]|uniref:DMT family transporter n=1 Tax=Chloroflexus sp. TaxID=1904827 RepID=UPI0026317B3D|nr:DMT family transporter [uncultured Chloroflexus sp.]